MKKLFAVLSLLFCVASVQAQNIEGQIIASQYGRWKVPGYSANTYGAFAPDSCRVQGGASFFFAFTVGTPISIVDSNPALTETVIPTAIVNSNVTCAISIAPVNDHQLPFYLTSATGGLQEALTQNVTTPQTNTVILDNEFYQMVGGATNAAAVIAAAQGSQNLGLVDITQVPTVWYRWNGAHYVAVGPPTNGGSTLVNDLFSNGPANAWQDLNDFVATDPTLYSPQAAVTAAVTHNGSAMLQPGAGRAPFSNTGNVRVQDNRADVPATARGVTEFGATCDLRSVYGTLAGGSTTVTILGGYTPLFSASDVGRTLVAVGAVGGVPTAFETAIASITDSYHAVMTTAAPFTQAVAHQMDLGHDDTAGIAQGLAAVGGTLVFPGAGCLTHTQSLRGQSPIGLGPASYITGFPGEDIFAAPDPSQTTGVNQGAAHIHDLTFMVDARIDATQPWQIINDAGTTAMAALYRPIAQKSGVSSNPLAPGWFQGPGANGGGAINGVASITAGSAVMCVPSTETAPAVGQTVVFPYLASVFTATVSSTAGSCTGATARTLSAALPAGASNGQAEWFAGTSAQNLGTAIGPGACPATITLSNPISPVPGYESNVAPFGLIQIDGEQFSYFARSAANNPTPAKTLYNIQCAQNGTVRAAHAAAATVVPLNNFNPSYPWPVTPTVNANDTTPSGTAGYFPGWNVGNAAFAFPLVTGINPGTGASGSWSANARIENLSFYAWPNDINGVDWQDVNHTAAFYLVGPAYASKFTSLLSQYLFYGIAEGPPSIENGNWASAQPTADGTSWDQVAIWAANPVNIPLGNQNTYSNFNVYSNENTTAGAGLGADTCFYFTAEWDDQTGTVVEANSLDVMTNLYCENENGPHNDQMPIWEWDTYNSEIHDMHMGGGGEVYIGGANQRWYGGNFNNSPSTPVINWGYGNTADLVTGLGSEPKGNSYGSSALENFAPNSKFSGQTAQADGSSTGPYGALQIGNSREPIPAQTNETFNTGNLTAPYTSSGGGFITPEEFNASFNFESEAMSQGWTYDATSPITSSYVGCNVGNNPVTVYCSTAAFNQNQISIGPGQRLVGGKYTLYVSMKDAVTAANTETMAVFSNCGSLSNTYAIPITNAWPATAASVFTAAIDLTPAAGAGCFIGFRFLGASTADQVQVGYADFAPVAENFNAQTITVTTIKLPSGTTGGTPTGCAQSPVTGINGGYTCPTKGWQSTLAANQGATDSTIALTSALGLSSSGCFFVDGEYECYAAIAGSTLTGLTRGAYTTSATTHNSGAPVVSVDLVLGSVLQPPADVVAYGGGEANILGVNNGFPSNHGGASVLSINSGSNETWADVSGGLHQTNSGASNSFEGATQFGTTPNEPSVTQSGYLWQSNGPNTAYSPMTLGGGHAGSLNIIATPTIAAPTINDFAGSGANTLSYVCSGTDFDGNLINGTTATVTNAPSTWAYPQFFQVVCPWTAGVNTYQIYRVVGGVNQGLIGSGFGPGFAVPDFNGSASGGTPPGSNGSNPHLSVGGTGNPSITLGAAGPQILAANGGPPSGCGSTYGNGSLYINTGGSTGAANLLYICNSATSAWVDIK